MDLSDIPKPPWLAPILDLPDPRQLAIFASWTPERRFLTAMQWSEFAAAQRMRRLERDYPDPVKRRSALLTECLGYDPEAP